MKCEKRKDVFLCLIGIAISFFLFTVFQNIIILSQSFSQIGLFIYDSLIIVEIAMLVYFAIRMNKLNYKVWSRFVSFFELTISLYYWIVFLLFSIGINRYTSPFFYVAIPFAVITLALRILFLFVVKKNRCKEMSGLILFKNLNIVQLIYLASFLIGVIIIAISKFSVDDIPQTINDIPQWLFIALTIYIVVSFACLLIVAYFMFTLLLSSFEDKPVELFRRLKYSLYIFRKYHIAFWFNAIVYTFLMVVSLASAFLVNTINFALAMFFLTILMTRVLNFAVDIHLKKKNYDDETHFRKRHLITLYCSLIFIIYAVLQLFVGNASMVNSTEKSNHNLIVTLIVVVPWALLRIIISILKRRIAKKSGDPANNSEAAVVGLIALYTLNNVIFSIGIATQNGILLLLGLVLAFVTSGYCLIAGIILLVISIKGLLNKRQKELELYLQYRNKMHQKDQLILEELDAF